MRLDIAPLPDEEVQALVNKVSTMLVPIVAKTKEAPIYRAH